MEKQEIIDLLKTMPTGITSKLRVGVNEYACKKLECTIEDIKLHNAEAKGFEEGYKLAVEKFKKWREEITAKIIY